METEGLKEVRVKLEKIDTVKEMVTGDKSILGRAKEDRQS